jgi:serine/threonine protein kinase
MIGRLCLVFPFISSDEPDPHMDKPAPSSALLRALALLDEFLEIGGIARRLRLVRLRVRDPQVAEQLERLIAADEQRDERLDRGLPEFTMSATEGRDLESMLGQRMGAWRIEGVLGHGGMGAVYEAQRADGHFEQKCALKIVRVDMEYPGARQRFLEERQFLAHLSHPNIASLIDGGVENDVVPWFAMELIHGVPIDVWCAQQALDVRSRIKLILGVLDAVHFAHGQLIIHRDIKPANLLVTPEGKVKLLDFGVSTLATTTYPSGEARGRVFGTPRFAAPEQMKPGPVSIGIDIYALGLLLHLLLSGRHAKGALTHATRNDDTTVGKHMSRVARGLSTAESATWSSTPRALARVLHGDLDAIVARCLEHDPLRRYTTVDALKGDLTAWLDRRPVSARPQTFLYLTERFLLRNRWPVLVLSLIFVVGLVAAMSAWENAATVSKDNEQVHQMLGVFNDVLSQSDTFGYGKRTFTVKDAADRSFARLLSDTSLDAVSRSRMLVSVGRIYYGLGMLAEACDALRRAVTFAPPGGADQANALLDLATYTYNLGKPAEAIEMMTMASTLVDALPSDPLNDILSAKIIIRRTAVEVILHELPPSTYIRNIDKALGLLNRHPDVLVGEAIATRVTLAEMLIHYSDRLDLASEQLTAVLDAATRHDLRRSTTALTAEALLPAIYLRRGKLDMARTYFEAAIRDWKAAYPDAPRLVTTFTDYADALERSGMFSQAVDASREAMRVQEELLQSHPERGLCRPMCAEVPLAQALQMSGDFTSSSTLLQPFVEKLRAPDGPRYNVNLASALAVLARNDIYTGDMTAVPALLREAEALVPATVTAREDVVSGTLHETRAESCLVEADFACAIREGERAAATFKEAHHDGTPTASEPANLLLQRNIAVAMLAQADTAPAGRARLNTASTLAQARYGACSPITRAIRDQRPVLSQLALQEASATVCGSPGPHSGH